MFTLFLTMLSNAMRASVRALFMRDLCVSEFVTFHLIAKRHKILSAMK